TRVAGTSDLAPARDRRTSTIGGGTGPAYCYSRSYARHRDECQSEWHSLLSQSSGSRNSGRISRSGYFRNEDTLFASRVGSRNFRQGGVAGGHSTWLVGG